MTDKETLDKIASLEYRITQLEANYSIIKERVFGIEQDIDRRYKITRKDLEAAINYVQQEQAEELRAEARKANEKMNTLDAIGQ